MKQKHTKLIVAILFVAVLFLAYRQNVLQTIAFSITPPESMLEHYTAYYYKYDEAYENMQRWDGMYIYGRSFGSTESVDIDVYGGELYANCTFTNACFIFCPLGDMEEYVEFNPQYETKSIEEFKSRWPYCNGQVDILKFSPNILYHVFPPGVAPPITQKVQELTQGISDKWERAQKIIEYVHSIPYPGETEEIAIFGWWTPTQVITGKKNTADCKTKSSLLVSLLRVSGFSEEEVFWVSTTKHAYVVVKYNGKWLPVDPTNTNDFFYVVKSPQYDWNPLLNATDSFGNDVYYYNGTPAFMGIVEKIREWEETPM